MGFFGGVHPDDHKADTAAKAIHPAPVPEFIILPLLQHIGAPALPLVAVGDRVLLGQKIAEGDGLISACLHSSVSGTVIAIEPRQHPGGGLVRSVVIENDRRDEQDPAAVPRGTVASLSGDEIVEAARQAGVVGLGGAAFPMHVKLRPKEKIDTLIINCAECEPYITSGFRAMVESTAGIVGGIRLVMKALGVGRAVIAVENNKLEAVDAFEKILPRDGDIRVRTLRAKYPQGGEKQLIRTITGREVPPGRLPSDVGCVVFNPETCLALYRAVVEGAPLLTRGVTVAGSAVANPKNLMVRIGTPISVLIDAAGGFRAEPSKIIMGGPMMGVAQTTLETPVIKSTGAVLAFAQGDGESGCGGDCIRCGRCVEVCPMHLMPVYISLLYDKKLISELDRYHADDCIECGACAYACPARLPLAQICRTAKSQLIQLKREGSVK